MPSGVERLALVCALLITAPSCGPHRAPPAPVDFAFDGFDDGAASKRPHGNEFRIDTATHECVFSSIRYEAIPSPDAATDLSDPGDDEFYDRHRAVGTDVQAGTCVITDSKGSAITVAYDMTVTHDGAPAASHPTGTMTLTWFRDLPEADQRAFVIDAFQAGEALMDEQLPLLRERCLAVDRQIYCPPAL